MALTIAEAEAQAPSYMHIGLNGETTVEAFKIFRALSTYPVSPIVTHKNRLVALGLQYNKMIQATKLDAEDAAYFAKLMPLPSYGDLANMVYSPITKDPGMESADPLYITVVRMVYTLRAWYRLCATKEGLEEVVRRYASLRAMKAWWDANQPHIKCEGRDNIKAGKDFKRHYVMLIHNCFEQHARFRTAMADQIRDFKSHFNRIPPAYVVDATRYLGMSSWWDEQAEHSLDIYITLQMPNDEALEAIDQMMPQEEVPRE